MRIGMLLPSDFPPDIRVEKEFASLSPKHDVFLLCPRRGTQTAYEDWSGLQIQRVFTRRQRWASQFGLMARQHSKLWEREIERFATEMEVEALHVHDLPLLGAALNVAVRHGLKVVADLHENYPAMLDDAKTLPWYRLSSLGSLVSHFAVSVQRWREYESRVVPRADHVIVVVEEAAERIVTMGVPRERITVVGNYATLDDDCVPPHGAGTADAGRGRLSAVYAGGFDQTRDLQTVLEAVAELPDSVRSETHVQLIGGTGRDLRRLEDESRRLGLEEDVTLRAWLPRAEAEQLMSQADVGLVPHVKSDHTDATVPHKLFQYMWRRLPVIVSDCAPLERIVRNTGCGLVYASGDSRSLAQSIVDLHALEDRGAAMGDAGRKAVFDTYNWPRAGDALLDVYRSLG